MYVKSMVIDGFKSYGQRTEINGFDPMFNAITGLNGSGKSNILDAICFLLGITNLSHVRAMNLQELVYKSGQAGVTKATVTVTFDNKDKKQSPIGYEHYDEVTVTRQVVIGGKNKYLINGSNVQNNRVQDFFRSVQLNVNNPHFLIMQGRITKVLNMKPPEILAMIEEAAGTRMYEAKKQQAIKTIEKKEEKIKEINDILSEEVTPTLNKLREERTQYLQFQKTERELEHLNRQYVAYRFLSLEQANAQVKEEYNELQKEKENHFAAGEKLKCEIQTLEKEIRSLQQQRDQVGGQELVLLEEKLLVQEKAESKAQSAVKVLKENIKIEEKKKKELKKSLADDTAALKGKEGEENKLGETFEKLRQREQQDTEALAAAQKRFQEISSGLLASENGAAATLPEELMATEKNVAQAESQLKHCEMTAQHLKKELKVKINEMKKSEADYKNDAQTSKHLENEVKKLEAELGKIHYDETQVDNLEQLQRSLKPQLQSLREKIESFEARYPQLNFRYTTPEKQFDGSAVKGVVCNLFDVPDVFYATALEVIAGGRLYNVIVDNDTTSKKLLQKGQLQTRVTFIPLNKIQGKAIDDRTTATAKKIVGKENCHTALSLIGFDQELTPAMQYIFGSSFVCNTIEDARKVTFHEQIMRKAVTYDGDIVDPGGLLTGGSKSTGPSLLAKLNELKQYRSEFEEKHHQLKNAEQELHVMEQASGQYRTLKQRYDVKRHEFELLHQRLQQTLHHRQTQEVETMKVELEAVEQKAVECAAIIKQGKTKIKELEDQVKNASKIRETQLKAAQAELERCKKAASMSQSKWKEHANEADSLKLELEELRKFIETTDIQLKETETTLAKYHEEMKNLNETLAVEQANVQEVRQEIGEVKERMAAQNQEISKRIASKEQRETQVNEEELLMKKLEHRLSKAKDDVKDSEKRVEAMLEKHPWISEDRHHFGVAGSNYDFNVINGAELGQRVNKFEESMKKLGRHVNVRSMTMLTQAEGQYNDLMRKKRIVEDDKSKIENAILKLDEKKKETLQVAWEQVTKDFGSIFSTLLPGTKAKLQPPEGQTVLDGLEVKVAFGGVWKESLAELSGGQRSLVALSLILAMLLFKPAPIYILDEVDAALDLSHTQNIGVMLKQHFKQSQFIVVSLKDGMFNNANVLFRTKFVEGMSTVSRLAQQTSASSHSRPGEDDESRPKKRK
ncbi:structural maintenance of chromosomes protein 2-like [Daphnia carinata]|uniref:structural maintenance of chromosomes protein 2-like n=1 Tax=Daphnia carinata TaxID=120202 RepID=UPI00257DFE24|nr:structural maintenance of chromosomes protein 2-like [Daphnia carinata]